MPGFGVVLTPAQTSSAAPRPLPTLTLQPLAPQSSDQSSTTAAKPELPYELSSGPQHLFWAAESSGSTHNMANSQKNTLCVLLPGAPITLWLLLIHLLVTEQCSSIKKEMKVVPGPPAFTGLLPSLWPTNLRMPSCLSE